jgi:hypothetical protein
MIVLNLKFFLKLCCGKRNSKTFQTIIRISYCNCKDRVFSETKPYVTLDGDNSIWQNKWNAGKEITWDMIHYDPIGGMVLHEGKLQRCKQVKENISKLTIYLNALTETVHLVTVNDYFKT